MKIKALVNFSGAFSMSKGEVLECNDEFILQDLTNAGYIEEVSDKDVKSDESK
ncbi:hypothetical protein [Aminipila terrae]|uniref:hypothetical protein n=1 Tax=Aminipila terrae TaxID=2697030 RepID=UPI00192F86DF|nr:hypothetical protein [Aminipila terrae]